MIRVTDRYDVVGNLLDLAHGSIVADQTLYAYLDSLIDLRVRSAVQDCYMPKVSYFLAFDVVNGLFLKWPVAFSTPPPVPYAILNEKASLFDPTKVIRCASSRRVLREILQGTIVGEVLLTPFPSTVLLQAGGTILKSKSFSNISLGGPAGDYSPTLIHNFELLIFPRLRF